MKFGKNVPEHAHLVVKAHVSSFLLYVSYRKNYCVPTLLDRLQIQVFEKADAIGKAFAEELPK